LSVNRVVICSLYLVRKLLRWAFTVCLASNEGMVEGAANSCPGCQRLLTQVEELRAQVAQQSTALQALQATVTTLREQLAAARKDSSTSSKPPSSDIVKPPPPPPATGQGRRQRGGQPGHPKHERPLFPPEQVEHFFVHPLDGCPCCGGPLRLNGGQALPYAAKYLTQRTVTCCRNDSCGQQLY
jgi:uncharacterized coiled-coil protein SlyX